ncbi:MAG: SiaB family protein kinase [Bacteroidales bacterium]|nr:SiaB family protein kinase [Bacteroidales bacterium]
MYSLYETFTDEKVSIAYFGVFNDGITSMLIELSEVYISKTDHLAKLSKKTSFLIAESFQNLIRHGIIEKNLIEEIQYNRDFYQISILDDSVLITSANVLDNKNVPKINEMIDQVNMLSAEELKYLRNQILEHGSLSTKGGAGLGLIEMVRKSKLPLQKLVIPLTQGYSLLLLGIMLPLKKGATVNEINIEKVGKFYRYLVEDGTLLLYKGDFSNSSNANIIDMLNDNFMKNGKIDPSKLKNIVAIIEVMQNVSKHGKKINGLTEGIFAVKELNEEIYIECSNFVRKEDYNNLKSVLKKIKASSIEELEALYKQKMAASYLSDDDNAGLGLLEIARFTENKFTYYFIETSENQIFFSIKIKTI